MLWGGDEIVALNRRTALARLTEVAARDLIPFAGRAVRRAKRAADQLAYRTLGPDFEERNLALKAHYQDKGGDPFGLDTEFTKYMAMVTSVAHRLWFRTSVYGIENVPSGGALLVSNHSGQFPLDGMMIAASMFMDAQPPRLVRAMVEKWAQTMPYISLLFSRTGQVVGVPDNCRRLLERDELILVFPEGARGVSKPFSKRYQLQDFGPGFMRMAMEMGVPIIPVAVVGAEEQYVNVGNLEWAAKFLGAPALPLLPQLLIPGGQLPLPTKYHIYFGEPMSFEGDPDDDELVEEQAWLVKQNIQNMLGQGLRSRQNIFF
ncbi:MAG: acyltransferase family protein [Polyangiaceae bacterium]|nr:acyltransferase family protein [Polyangiaceae bacterium]